MYFEKKELNFKHAKISIFSYFNFDLFEFLFFFQVFKTKFSIYVMFVVGVFSNKFANIEEVT